MRPIVFELEAKFNEHFTRERELINELQSTDLTKEESKYIAERLLTHSHATQAIEDFPEIAEMVEKLKAASF